MKMPTAKVTHFERLDVLRGLAILSVFIFHFFGTALTQDHLPWKGAWLDFSGAHDPWFLRLYPLSFCWVGVSLFFVISGFCIHWSYLQRPSFSVRKFYSSRFWRIYPSYLLALAGCAILTRLDITSADGKTQLASHIFLLHNFSSQTVFGINPAFWSLATECQFYLVYPLVILARSRWGLGPVLMGALVLSIAFRCGALLIYGNAAAQSEVITSSPLGSWFDWMLGAYIAERLQGGDQVQPRRLRVDLPVLATLFVASTFFLPASLFSSSLAALASALVMERILRSKSGLRMPEPALAALGVVSYSFYLWHQPLIGRILKTLTLLRLPDGKLWIFAIGLPSAFAVVWAVSQLFYRVVERSSLLVRARPKSPTLPALAANLEGPR